MKGLINHDLRGGIRRTHRNPEKPFSTVSIDVSDRISGTAKRKRSMSKSKAWGIEFFSNPDI
jgi:hypothetical protein